LDPDTMEVTSLPVFGGVRGKGGAGGCGVEWGEGRVTSLLVRGGAGGILGDAWGAGEEVDGGLLRDEEGQGWMGILEGGRSWIFQ